MANGTTTGALSSSDWNLFNNKLNQSSFNTYVASANCSSSQTMYWNSVSSQFLCASISIPSSQVTGLVSSATIDTTNATNITGGTLSTARLPGLTGDISSATGSGVLTLSNSGVSAGTYTKVTVDLKGRVTTGASLSSVDVTTALGFTPMASGSYVDKTGDSMTGALNLPINGLTVGTNQIVVSSGKVGIGTVAPVVSLDVAGAVRAGSETAVTACGSGAANSEGSQRYNYTNHVMEYCNGSAWVTAPTLHNASATTTCSAGNKGQISYNSANGETKICTGISWRLLGAALEDKIENSLSTNKATYIAAQTGSYVSITAAEYAALQTNVTSTSVAGQKDAASLYTSLSDWGESSYLFTATTTGTTGAVTGVVPSGNWVYAFSYKTGAAVTNRTIRLMAGPATKTAGYRVIGNGSSLHSNTAGEIKYFVLKGGYYAPEGLDVGIWGGSFANASIASHQSYYTTTFSNLYNVQPTTNWATNSIYVHVLTTSVKQW